MGGSTNCNSKAKAKTELKKGPWTRDEDQKLLAYIQEHGHGSWRSLPAKAGLQRCGKSCRLRWTNYLRPDIKRGKFSTHEEKTIIRLHALLGNRWSIIAAHLTKRTDNEIKNYWNTRLKKRLARMGIDPTTHKPKNNPAQSRHAAALSHMAQWEAARLEAEARLTLESKLVNFPLLRKLHSAPLPPPPSPPPRHAPCLDVLKVWQSSAIPGRFFSSPGSCSSQLESPTSTLNFSCANNNLTVPTVSSIMATNDAVLSDAFGVLGGYSEAFDKTENPYHTHGDYNQVVYDSGHDCDLAGLVGPASFDQYPDGYGAVGVGVGGECDALASLGEFEESKNYWNYLLDMVSSPMMEPPPL